MSRKVLKQTTRTVIFGTPHNPHDLSSTSLGTFSDSIIERSGGMNRSDDPENRSDWKYDAGDQNTVYTSDFRNIRSHHTNQTRMPGNLESSSNRVTLKEHREYVKASPASAAEQCAAGSTPAELNGTMLGKVSKLPHNFPTNPIPNTGTVKNTLTINLKNTNYPKKYNDDSKQKFKGSGTKSSFSKLKLNKPFYYKGKIQEMNDGDSQNFEISNDSTKQSAGQYGECANQTGTGAGGALSTEHASTGRGGDEQHRSSGHVNSALVPYQQQHPQAGYTRHALASIKGAYCILTKNSARVRDERDGAKVRERER